LLIRAYRLTGLQQAIAILFSHDNIPHFLLRNKTKPTFFNQKINRPFKDFGLDIAWIERIQDLGSEDWNFERETTKERDQNKPT
jgi:hypothetical protein